MWSWAPWSSGQGRGEEKEETKKQQNMAERQRQRHGPGYYQRSRTEELPPKASEAAAVDKGKVSKHDSSQEKDGLDESYTALDQALKDNQELQRKQADSLKHIAELEKRNKELKANLATKEAEVTHLQSYEPASTLSTDSERHYTLYSSLSENGSERRGLFQVATDSDILLRLQKDSEGKDDTIKSLEAEVNQLKKKLKYAEQLEEQNFRLTTEESKHEEEKQMLRREVEALKRRASVSRPLTRSYAHEQKLQELAQRYYQQYHEELEENSRLREKISQLEKEIQGQVEGTVHIDEVDDPDLNAELRRKDQHIHTLQAQVEALQQYSKGQSKNILQLKQELEAVKVAGEEIDTSWRVMVDQLEEENRKLSQDVGALHRDKKFIAMSMETTKARNEELEPLVQELQAQVEALQQHSKGLSKQNLQLKQELEAVKVAGEDIDTSWRIMVDQLEEENKNLSMENRKVSQDVAALHRDKKFLVKSMETTKARNEDLESLAQKLQAQVEALQQHSEGQSKQILHLKQELEALKVAGEDIDTSWRIMVDQLEEENKNLSTENRKLSLDVGALHQDKKFLVQSMDTTKARNEDLESLAQKLQARVAELEGESTEMKTALSKAEHDRQRIYQELSKLMTEKEAAQAEQLQLRQLTQEKDQFLQSLQSEKDQLRQQLSALSWQIQRYAQQPQSQHPHESNFWEVPRNEITLNMHKILGIGAWGFVVEGIFRSQKVAVKCLHDMIRQPKVIELIRKEISIMAQIRHPNMVMLIAAVIDGENDPLIVTELLDISLRKAYEKHLLQGSSKLSIFRDVASALNYLHLHQQGEIIHRDVSSANVLLEAKPSNQWKAKLSDFGSAKLAIEAKTTGPGAPAYTAPEVQREMGIRQTAKLDVYSYGILLCEVIVEQFPMDGSLPSMMGTVRNRWPFMHGLVTSCLQEHPDNRPTMSYVLGEFDKLRPKE